MFPMLLLLLVNKTIILTEATTIHQTIFLLFLQIEHSLSVVATTNFHFFSSCND